MKRVLCWSAGAASIALACAGASARADGERLNRGNDPYFQVSRAIAACATPLGPFETEDEWRKESHWRVERGNSCWWEGRCRLSNGYLYDKEIDEAVHRRLNDIEPAMHWQHRTTLWLMLQRRFVYVMGCVAPDFDKRTFLAELAKTADVERVIDETTTDPASNALPYRTLADPDKLPVERGGD